ncbi:MAG: DEAD/DEAH box helicase family protein [Hyphomicrobium sp.]
MRTPPPLRIQQEEASAAISSAFESLDRVQISMACGTGKSYVALASAERLEASLTVLLAPTISLSQQVAETARRYDYHERILVVCTTRERDAEIEATTDISDVCEFLNSDDYRPTLIVGTYASAKVVGSALSELDMSADLLVFDEAHRVVGDVQRVWSRALTDRGLAAKKRLFMTATQKFVFARQIDHYVASMDDESLFGPLVYDLPFGVAVERGMIAEVDVAIVVSRESSNPEVVPLQALESARAKFDIQKVITFHGRVAEADALSRALAANGDVAFHVSGRSPNNKEVLKAFSAEPRAVLTNARMLSEGIDVPDVTGVMICSVKRSHVDIAQCVGRASRLSPGKAKGWVILPIALPEDTPVSQALQQSKYSELWNQLLNLAGLRGRYRPEAAVDGGRPASEGITVLSSYDGAMLEEAAAAITGELDARAAGLRSMVWASTAARCLELVERETPLGSTLHGWLASCRERLKEGRLTLEQAAMIEKIEDAFIARQSERERKARERAESYMAEVRAGLPPHADQVLAKSIRDGAAGDDIREEFDQIVVTRKSERRLRAERYVENVESGAPLSIDTGAAKGIAAGYYGEALLARLNAERERRNGRSEKVVAQFLEHYKHTGSTILTGRTKHPGYVRLHSKKFRASEYWKTWLEVKAAFESADLAKLDSVVIHYEATGRVTDRKAYSRIINYPAAYPELATRLRAAQVKRGRI